MEERGLSNSARLLSDGWGWVGGSVGWTDGMKNGDAVPWQQRDGERMVRSSSLVCNSAAGSNLNTRGYRDTDTTHVPVKLRYRQRQETNCEVGKGMDCVYLVTLTKGSCTKIKFRFSRFLHRSIITYNTDNNRDKNVFKYTYWWLITSHQQHLFLLFLHAIVEEVYPTMYVSAPAMTSIE